MELTCSTLGCDVDSTIIKALMFDCIFLRVKTKTENFLFELLTLSSGSSASVRRHLSVQHCPVQMSSGPTGG